MYSIYLRKSRADAELERLGEGETLARHRKTLTELAEKHGYTIGEIYEEIVSGETIAARPQMQRLLSDVEQGRWDGVLVMELERLARGNSIDQGIVAQAFQLTETLIITPNKVFDPANEFDQEYFEFGLFMSRREYKTINRRLQAGRLASVKEGNFIGSAPPYGYDKVRLERGQGFTLVPNADADNVRLIFEMFVNEGATANKIADHLTMLGVRPQKGGDYFSAHSVRDILRNRAYAGYVVWNSRPTKKIVKNGCVSVARPRNAAEKVLVFKGKHKAVISSELFEAAQERIGKTPRLKPDRELVNPFAHLCRCRECGHAIVYRPNSKSADMLICPNKYCGVSGVAFEIADKIVLKELTAQLGSVKAMRNGSRKEAGAARTRTEHIKRELETLSKQQNRLFDLLEQGVYDQQTFVERQTTLKERRFELDEQLAAIDKEFPDEKEIDRMIATLDDLIARYDRLTPSQKNGMLLSCVQKMTYFREKSNRYDQKPVLIDIRLKF